MKINQYPKHNKKYSKHYEKYLEEHYEMNKYLEKIKIFCTRCKI